MQIWILYRMLLWYRCISSLRERIRLLDRRSLREYRSRMLFYSRSRQMYELSSRHPKCICRHFDLLKLWLDLCLYLHIYGEDRCVQVDRLRIIELTCSRMLRFWRYFDYDGEVHVKSQLMKGQQTWELRRIGYTTSKCNLWRDNLYKPYR